LSAAEQSTHVISLEVEPEPGKWPRPAGHVDHAVHCVSAFVSILKKVTAQLVHLASDVLSAEGVKYWPALQVVFLAAQDVSALVYTLKSFESQSVHVASAWLSAEAL